MTKNFGAINARQAAPQSGDAHTHTQDTFDMLNICNGNANSPDSALKAKPIWDREGEAEKGRLSLGQL